MPAEEWLPLLDQLADKLKQYCYLMADIDGAHLANKCNGDYEQLRTYIRDRGIRAYYEKRSIVEEKQSGLMRDVERFFFLAQTDNLWKEHLQAIKFLQQAVGLRGYAQRDPLTEFKLEAFNLFLDMQCRKRRNTIYNVYVFQPIDATGEVENGSKKDRKKARNKQKTSRK